MKKKILLISLMVMLLVCLFAISVSAATIYKDAQGNELFRYVDANADYDFDSYSGSFPKTDSQGNELTWYITATTEESGNTVHTVASLKTLGEAGNINASGVYSFTSPVTRKNVVSLNFPDNAGIKKLPSETHGGNDTRKNGTAANLYNTILFAYYPNTLTELPYNPFQETSVIVVELDDEMPITSIPQNFAHDARNLERINIPATVQIMNGSGYKAGTPFYNNYSLVEVTFASNNTLTKMTGSTFSNCKSLTEVKLPATVKEIGERCFEGCTNLQRVWLGASLEKTTGYSVFRMCPNLKVYYIPNTFTSVYQHTFTHDSGNGPADTVFFFAGTKAELEAFYNACVAGQNNPRVTSGYKEEYLIKWDPTKPDSYYTNLATTGSHKLYVYDYNKCVAFYDGAHTLDPEQSNACAGVCKTCNEIQQAQNPEHEWHTTITYADLAKNGEKLVVCTHENCAMATAEPTSVEPIFVYLGFATEKNSVSQFCVGYLINQAELEAYKQANQTEAISYGLVATAIANTNAPIGADGNRVNEKVVQANLSSVENAEEILSVDFIIKGDFTNETNAYAELGMALYVTRTVDQETTVSYIGNAGSTATIEAVTFADKFPALAPEKKEEIA